MRKNVKKNCNKGAVCKGSCISRLKNCPPIIDEKSITKVKSAAERLRAVKPKALESRLNQKRGLKRIQYMSQNEVLSALVVYSKDVLAIKAGKIPHPYINMRMPKEEEITNLHNKIKIENRPLYEKLAELGLRKDREGRDLTKEEKVKVAIEVYLQQDGKSFATGKAVSINKMSLDHLIPVSAGGKNEASNLVLIESNINYVKGARSLKGFLDTLQKKAALVNSPADLEKFKAAIKTGDASKIAVEQKQLQISNRIARLSADRAQALKALQGAKAKAAAVMDYMAVNELGVRGYARYDSPSSINGLNATELKNVTKAQSLAGNGIARWYRSPGTGGSQVEYPTGDALKAQVFLNNGGRWQDLPQQWKDSFKDTFLKNTNSSGSNKVAEAYKTIADLPEWLK